MEAVTPFLEAGLSAEEAKKVGQAFIDRIENEDDLKTAANEVDEEEGEPLTPKPLKFSLAYGTPPKLSPFGCIAVQLCSPCRWECTPLTAACRIESKY